MSELITVPTVEQINLEHQLANNKAAEAVQHATNCGLMLLQVKASKPHGEWLPWLNGEIESGRLKVKIRQAQSYMQLASNTQRAAYLEAPSIRAALELLSEKEPEAQQGTLIDVEAERQARIAAEQKAEEEQRRSSEWRDQWKQQRDETEKTLGQLSSALQEKGTLQLQLNALKNQPVPKPQVIEKAPDDYEALKAKAAQLETELATNKAEQTRIIQSAIKAKLSGYQGEVDALEAKKRHLEQQAKEYQDYLASLTGTAKQMEAQARAFEKTRQALVDLASELADFKPINPQLNRKALALADMNDAAAQSIRIVFSENLPELTLIKGGA